MAERMTQGIVDQLARDISSEVGNMHEDELEQISSSFDKTLAAALNHFNSTTFDDSGFIRRMRDLDLDSSKDKDVVRNVLNGLANEYINVGSINQTELLLRRDLANICTQMPEMRDVIYVVRDSIIECNVATGEVSRDLIFENHDGSKEAYETQVKEIEARHNLLMAIKNFIVPNTLKTGELYIQVVPYAKLFAELEALRDSKHVSSASKNPNKSGAAFKESVPRVVMDQFKNIEPKSLYSDDNVKRIMESVSAGAQIDGSDSAKISEPKMDSKVNVTNPSQVTKEAVSSILSNIEIYPGSSTMFAEYGFDGFQEVLVRDYVEQERRAAKSGEKKTTPETHFAEAMNFNRVDDGLFSNIDQDGIDISNYKDVKGCYIKYLDPLRMIPIRIDRRIIGYYYVTTTMDLQANSGNANGVIDLSYRHYTRDRGMVENLANMIIRSFDKKMLEKNIKLKNEIADIIMAHRFTEGKLSFVYIPENEVVRLVINEDEEGRGHSIIEPSIFPARMYLMLTMYNMLYTLNNNTTRIHYVKSSGLNKNYAAQVQRTMRSFASRRISIDDIYSFSGVLNKIGGMGEMVLPAGRNDYKALETDTIEAVQNPINMEFLEQQRRQAIAGTGVPHLLIINAIDEVDFAKTLEMANTRYLSTVSSYKIDFNRGLTVLYQRLLKYSTDMEDDIVQSFKFKFHPIKQQDLQITADMIQNFNQLVELVAAVYFEKNEIEDKDGDPTPVMKHLRRELARKYIPQLDFDELDDVISAVKLAAGDDKLQQKVTDLTIEDEDLAQIEDEKK